MPQLPAPLERGGAMCEKGALNHFPLLIKVSLIINICFGSPKSGNTTCRIANTKPILK